MRPSRAASLLPAALVVASMLASPVTVAARPRWPPFPTPRASPTLAPTPTPTPTWTATPSPSPTVVPSAAPSTTPTPTATPLVGPIISAVAATEITATTATIRWHVSEPATGQTEYGTTIGYGQRSVLEASFDYVDHIQALSGLTPGTLYHFRVISTDVDGNAAVSADATFRTLAAAAPSPTATPRPTPVPTPAPASCPPSLQAAIDAAPNGTTLDFTGCSYTVRATIAINGRSDITVVGGAVHSMGYFPTFSLACDTRVTLRGWTITGSDPTPGTYKAGQEDAHGVQVLGGSQVTLDRLSISAVYGDAIYLAQCGTTNGQAASITNLDADHFGRMGIAVVAFNSVLARDLTISNAGFRPLDIEPECNRQYQQQAQDITFDTGTVSGYIRKDPSGTVHGTSWFYIGTVSCDGGIAPKVARVTVHGFEVNATSPFSGLWTDISPNGYRIDGVTITGNASDSVWQAGGGVIRCHGTDALTVSGNRQSVASGPLVAVNDCTAVVQSGNTTAPLG